jgi:hypothetical protein
MIIRAVLPIILFLLIGCKENHPVLSYQKAKNDLFYYQGRFDVLQDSSVALISSGSSVSINFSGDHCEVYLRSKHGPYNYVSMELDGQYLGRLKIESDSLKPHFIEVPSNEKSHLLKIFKESEPSNGEVLFDGIKVAEILPSKVASKKYIEFIGNSITCGAAADASEIPCGTGEYFDQQNVYFSYGARVARKLNVDFMLSSVSGIGIYRNWNDENIDEPIMPQVYENLYLNIDSSKKYDFSIKPNIVSICLGTNDLSDGDGIKPRLPFNKEKFVANYIDFVKAVYKHYPDTKIVLLNSPMVEGEKNEILVSCLKEVQSYFKINRSKIILLFEFNGVFHNGCYYHPNIEEHKEIAEQLTPFFKNLLN